MSKKDHNIVNNPTQKYKKNIFAILHVLFDTFFVVLKSL